MPTQTLRRATPPDAAAVRALTRDAYAAWVPLIGREPWPMTADYDHAIANHRIDLWEENGTLLALIETIPAPDHLLIENLAVRPDRHGRGLGSKLLQHAESLALASDVRELRLYTNAAFTYNIAYYAKRGFVEFRREPIATNTIAVHMRKPVAGAS